MTKPILDGKPTTRGKNWSFSKIQEMKGIKPGVAPRPAAYKNPLAPQTAPRDQDARGTCCGQSGAHCYDIEYMTLMKDLPNAADIAQFKTNVIDQIGTTHDILYPESASAESFYQMSRKIGNVTYPSGSEILFVCRAWCQYGMNLESQWHTDKLGTCVWMYPPGPRVTNDGGIDPVTAATFAALTKRRDTLRSELLQEIRHGIRSVTRSGRTDMSSEQSRCMRIIPRCRAEMVHSQTRAGISRGIMLSVSMATTTTTSISCTHGEPTVIGLEQSQRTISTCQSIRYSFLPFSISQKSSSPGRSIPHAPSHQMSRHRYRLTGK